MTLTISVKDFLTRADYDKGGWKAERVKFQAGRAPCPL
jgi:hypothetical protein